MMQPASQSTAPPPAPASAREPAPIEYRRPGAVNASETGFLAAVQRREAKYQAGAWFMALAGAGALLIGCAVAAGIVDGIQQRLRPQDPFSWWTCFAAVLAALIPLLFWFEIHTRGRWFDDEINWQASSGGSGPSASYGEWELRCAAASWAVFIEVLLWGPRLIFNARQRWRRHVSPLVVAEAAALINFLRHFEGIAVAELPVVRPAPVLNYLITRDWIGISEARDRVWLLTDARKALGLPAD
jgi:hypothetical protein